MGGPEIKPPPGETIPAEALGGLTVDELVAVLRNDVETYRFAGQVEIPAAIAELAKRDLSDWPHDLTEEEAAAVASAAERGESSG